MTIKNRFAQLWSESTFFQFNVVAVVVGIVFLLLR